MGSMTPKFEFERDFCTVHLTAKLYHPTFNRSEVIVLTNRQTDKQTDAVESIHLAPLCYAVGKYILTCRPQLTDIVRVKGAAAILLSHTVNCGRFCFWRRQSVVFCLCMKYLGEPLNGFAPRSHGRRVWSLARMSLKVKVKGQRDKNTVFFGSFGGVREVSVW